MNFQLIALEERPGSREENCFSYREPYTEDSSRWGCPLLDMVGEGRGWEKSWKENLRTFSWRCWGKSSPDEGLDRHGVGQGIASSGWELRIQAEQEFTVTGDFKSPSYPMLVILKNLEHVLDFLLFVMNAWTIWEKRIPGSWRNWGMSELAVKGWVTLSPCAESLKKWLLQVSPGVFHYFPWEQILELNFATLCRTWVRIWQSFKGLMMNQILRINFSFSLV